LKSEKSRFDVVFADPPYERGHALSTLRSLDTIQCMNAGGIVVLEHGAGEVVPEGLTHFKRSDRRRYGKTLVSFYDFVV
jgi:16S rRNA G966 N2-methylase RsmD